MATVMRQTGNQASLCVKCGKCEQQCPQCLPIRENLELVKKELETPVYRVARQIRRFIKL